MNAGYIYDKTDEQGPWVLLCESCIAVDYPNQAPDWKDPDDHDWRCACCGATSDVEVWR